MAGENDKWEEYQDKRGEWRWRRTAPNGNIVGRSCEGYNKRGDSTLNAERHGMNGNPSGNGNSDKWEFYKDKRGEWRWRRIATNGAITGAVSEGYYDRNDCEANAARNGWNGQNFHG